jgi:hypothetical protein
VKAGTAREDVGHEAGSLTILKVTVEPNEGLAASNARRLFSEKHATYARFIASIIPRVSAHSSDALRFFGQAFAFSMLAVAQARRHWPFTTRGVFRQFHVKGFVNQYVLDPSS